MRKNFTCVVTILLLSLVSGAIPSTAQDSVFVASKKWFRLEGDEKRDLFRGYAGLITAGGIVGLPNLFVLHCPPDNAPYLTLHFPDEYKFQGFASDAWIPKTHIFFRTVSGTFKFDAELNKNEFHVDLDENSFKNLRSIWNSDGPIDLKVGPTEEDVRLVLGDKGIDDSTRDMIGQQKPIVDEHLIESVAPMCLARSMESSRGGQLIIWGAVWCPSCDGSEGETFSFVKITPKKGKRMRNESECLKVKRDFERSLVEAAEKRKDPGMFSELLCLRVETP